ncbi:hypothetical protein C8J57DRAFT_1520436 [Mycena rebaudengoi]|nr:hypothetical protein C8J57DRAFT_1520436 [Mycena rebaudengoi]
MAATALPPTPQTPGNVRLCPDVGFNGDCLTVNGGSTQCVNVPGSLNDQISSFGPDDGQDCFIFAYNGPIRIPGISNLNDVGFNDKMLSWKCFFG